MANEVAKRAPIELTPALVSQAWARGIISTADMRAYTALRREERLATSGAGSAKNALREFMEENQAQEEAAPTNGKAGH